MANQERTKEVRKIERHLRNYKTYKVGLKTLKKQLEYIMPNITSTYELVEGSSGTFNIKSSTENYAIDRIESKRALDLHEDIRLYELFVNSIDDAINELEDTEKKFVVLRYIEGYTVTRTAEKLRYSEKHIFDIRNQTLDKLLISLRGLMHF